MSQNALSNLFKLLAVAHRMPSADLAKLVVEGTLASDLQATWTSLELPREGAEAFVCAMGSYDGRDATEVLHELRREWTRLFLGKFPLIENSEGPWRKKREGKEEVALIVNSYSTEVQDFMRFCGVVRPAGYNDCVDYLENEFDFAGLLAEQPEYLSEKGIDPLAKLDEFIDGHLMLWVNGFCDDVIARSTCTYYKALCAFTKEFMAALA